MTTAWAPPESDFQADASWSPPEHELEPSTASGHAAGALELATQHPFTAGVGMAENALSSVTGGVGSLADAVTGADPGTHDWAYRPRTEAGQQIANLAGQETGAIGRSYDATFGTGPLASTIKERIPEALGAVGTVTGLAEAPHMFARGKPGAAASLPKEAPKPPSTGGFKVGDLAEKPPEATTPAAEAPKANVAPEAGAAPGPSGKPTEPILTTLDADGAAQYTPEQKASVKQRLDEKLTSDPAAARAEYAAHPDTEGGKVLSTDIARDLSPDYNAGKEARSALAADVHEPASKFIKDVYKEKLAEAPKEGEQPTVMFTAGGTGAGKTSGIDGIPAMAKLRDEAQIVYDTNMNKFDSATSKIDQARAADKNVHIVYTYRDPVEAFANGTLTRAERQGRTVPIEEQQKTHAGSYETVQQLRQRYINDPGVRFTAVDNSLGKGKSAVVPFSALEGKRYNAPVDELRPVVESAFQAGKISKRVYNGTLGVKSVNQEGNAAAGAQAVARTTGATAEVPPVGRPSGPGNSGEPAAENSVGAGPQTRVPDTGGAQAPGGNSGSRPQGAPEALNHPLEFLPPEAEGTKTAAVPSAEQESRVATLRELGLKEARESAISGDYKETGTDFQTSRLDHAGGKRLNSVMENERHALRDYSEGLVEKSGGTAGTDSVERRVRGKTIAAPIEAYNKALETETKRLYGIADQRAAGQPIELRGVSSFLSNKAQFLGTTEGKQLLEGVTARAKELGLLGPNETFNPATVTQAESLRQYLNENWSSRTSKLIGKMKDAIDEDVTKAAGTDIYAAGRAVRTARSMNLEEPEGVSKLLGPDDRLGINRDVAHEDIPKYVTSLDADQFGHVVRVLKEAGKNSALEPKAVAALNEIRATFANGVRDAGESTAGMWNAKAVNKYLRDNRARMESEGLFTPEELKDYQTLNDGGRILRMDRSYPGAAAQGHNFVVNGVLKGAEHGATAVGGVMAHVPGMIVGHAIGKGAKVLDARALSSAIEKRIRAL